MTKEGNISMRRNQCFKAKQMISTVKSGAKTKNEKKREDNRNWVYMLKKKKKLSKRCNRKWTIALGFLTVLSLLSRALFEIDAAPSEFLQTEPKRKEEKKRGGGKRSEGKTR